MRILGEPGAVSRAGRKGARKVFKHRRKSPWVHPRRPRGGQSGREKRRDKRFQEQAKKPLGTDSHRTISKRSSDCWLLIGHKKCFVLLCPIGEQLLLSSFREFVHDGFDSITACLAHAAKKCTQSGIFQFDSNRYISKYW